MTLTLILDALRNLELMPECGASLAAACSRLRCKFIVLALDDSVLANFGPYSDVPMANESPILSGRGATALKGVSRAIKVGDDVEMLYFEPENSDRLKQSGDSKGLSGAYLNAAAKHADSDFILFLRPGIIADAEAIALLLEALGRDMSIGCAAPGLATTDGKPSSSEFILIQDEYKRRPLDVLIRPPDPGRTETWSLPPNDGIAFSADALMVRRTAFWGVGGWDEELADGLMDLTFGLALKDQLWRSVFVQRSVMATIRPQTEIRLSADQSQCLVQTWFGRFIPHALRTADAIIRNHPWCAQGMGSIPVGQQHAGGPFDPLAHAGACRPGYIPGERCSVVVVTYNSMESIPACITSVMDALGTFDELIIVDNCSRDETPAFLTGLRESDPRITVVLNDKNLGFSEACNIGILASNGEYVVLLNPDTVVSEGWLGRMHEYFSDSKVGAVGPISNGVCGLQRFEFHLPRKTRDGLSPAEIHKLAGQVNTRRSVETKLLIGFCLMLKRTILNEVGWLDPDLFLGCDDLDISWRLRLAGYKLLIATDVFVLHRVHVSFKTESAEVVQELSRRSCDAFGRKLAAYYGEGKVPSQEDIWGIDWFDSKLPIPNAAPAKA